MASSYPKTDLIKNFLSIFLLNHSSNVFRSRHIVFKKVLLNQEYNIILLMGILNMQIQQGFVPPGDETAINWAPEHCRPGLDDGPALLSDVQAGGTTAIAAGSSSRIVELGSSICSSSVFH